MDSEQTRLQFLRPFVRVLLAHPQYESLHLQRLRPGLLVPSKQRIARLTADAEPLALAREVTPRVLLHRRDELESLIHDAGLFPRHGRYSSPLSQPHGGPARHSPRPPETVRGGPGLFCQGRTRSVPIRNVLADHP